MTDLSDLAIRHAATKVRVIRPGVEPHTAIAVIRALLAMGWAPPAVGPPRANAGIEALLADAQRALTSAIQSCTALSQAHSDLIRTRDNLVVERNALLRRLTKRFDDHAEAVRLLEYALHLRMQGERAPGGDETWGVFDRDTEAFLRASMAPAGGYPPVGVPENTGKHPAESHETGTNTDRTERS